MTRWLVLVAALASCAHRDLPAATPAPIASAAPAAPACADGRFSLEVEDWHGVLRRVFLPIAIAGQPARLMIDTGSPHSFVFEAADRHGTVQAMIGCHDYPVGVMPASVVAPPPSFGAIGLFGTDAVLTQTTDIDPAARTMTFYGSQPPATPAREIVAMEIVQGVALVELEIDGRKRTLMLDTGTADLILLEPSHGVADQHTVDAFGQPIDFEVGTAAVRWPSGAVATVPCWRTLHHPAFERHAATLGRKLDGLLGLSALGGARFAFVPSQHAVWIGTAPPAEHSR